MNLKEITVKVIDSYDFDDLVKSTYGQDYECVAEEEWDNKGCHLFEGVALISKYSWYNVEEIKQKCQNWKDGKLTNRWEKPYLYEIFHDLCARGVIEEGNYLIQVNH